MDPIEWSPTEVLGSGWEKVKADPAGLILPIFVVSLIQGIPNGVLSSIASALEQNDAALLGAGIRLISTLIGLLLRAWLAGGTMTLLLKAVRGQEYSLSDVFSGGRFFVPMFITVFLIQLASIIGLAFCVVPGIVIGLGLSFAVPLLVDRNLSAIDALKESWRITTGHKMNLLVFGLLCTGVVLVGMMACCVGVFAATTVIAIAQMFVYERLTSQDPPTAVPPVNF